MIKQLTSTFHTLRRPWRLLAPILVLVFLAGCDIIGGDAYEETFDTVGKWGTDERPDVVGKVKNGVYDLLVKDNYGLYLATADENFSDGIYEVEATQLAGPLNNGYGLLFRVDNETDSFYVFEVSGDGFIWIGRCSNSCNDVAVPLVSDDWFRSPAVKQGLQATNQLRVVAEGQRMTFFVNGVEVGRASDNILSSGDIAVMVETLGQRNVRVAFDNFKVTPPEESE